jgi:hypothetical protein
VVIGGVYDIPVLSKIGSVSETYWVEEWLLNACEIIGIGVEVLEHVLPGSRGFV